MTDEERFGHELGLDVPVTVVRTTDPKHSYRVTTHFRVEKAFAQGRLARKQGALLCNMKSASALLVGELTQDVSCGKCRDRLVGIVASRCRRPALAKKAAR